MELRVVRRQPEIHLAIVGCRSFTNQEVFNYHMTEWMKVYGLPGQVISGGAAGADTLGEQWAQKYGIPLTVLKPDWTAHGKGAGIRRNTDIILAATHVIAFPSAQSRGTRDSIRKAQQYGRILQVVEI